MTKASHKAKSAIKGVRIHNPPIWKSKKYLETIMYFAIITSFAFDKKNQSFQTRAPQINPYVLLNMELFFYFLPCKVPLSTFPLKLDF
jgi:hypothetical protein